MTAKIKTPKITKAEERILTMLREVHEISTMKGCGLSDACKEEMKLWVNSWIEDPLERIIQLIESKPTYTYWNGEFIGTDKDGNEIKFDCYGRKR